MATRSFPLRCKLNFGERQPTSGCTSACATTTACAFAYPAPSADRSLGASDRRHIAIGAQLPLSPAAPLTTAGATPSAIAGNPRTRNADDHSDGFPCHSEHRTTPIPVAPQSTFPSLAPRGPGRSRYPDPGPALVAAPPSPAAPSTPTAPPSWMPFAQPDPNPLRRSTRQRSSVSPHNGASLGPWWQWCWFAVTS